MMHTKLKNHLTKLYWLSPFLTYSADASAWGLVTHIYFAQSLVWAMPLLDPRLQSAIRRFPELVMAGACLPDLALMSPAFRHTHQWENAQQLLLIAKSEEETAIAIGYASHLYIDVIAHNHFVPAHEAMWVENTIATHIAVEWAMDGHLAPLMQHTPKGLLTKHRHLIAEFISPHFRCSQKRSHHALKQLAFWDGVLRFLRVPSTIYLMMKILDKRVFKNFAYYIAKTQTAIANISSVLLGQRPQWEPELTHLNKEEMIDWRQQCLRHLDALHPAPIQYFNEPLQRKQASNSAINQAA